jgi:hypothetical protein
MRPTPGIDAATRGALQNFAERFIIPSERSGDPFGDRK